MMDKWCKRLFSNAPRMQVLPLHLFNVGYILLVAMIIAQSNAQLQLPLAKRSKSAVKPVDAATVPESQRTKSIAVDKPRCQPNIDLLFVIDVSGSQRTVYDAQKKLALEISRLLPVSKGGANVGVIQYAGYPLVDFPMTGNQNKHDVQEQLTEMFFRSGITRTGSALVSAEHVLLQSRRRRVSRRIILLMTDGISLDDPTYVARKLRATGVTILVASLTDDPYKPELEAIAGSANYVFYHDSIPALKEEVQRIVTDEAKTQCNESTPDAIGILNDSDIDVQNPNHLKAEGSSNLRVESNRNLKATRPEPEPQPTLSTGPAHGSKPEPESTATRLTSTIKMLTKTTPKKTATAATTSPTLTTSETTQSTPTTTSSTTTVTTTSTTTTSRGTTSTTTQTPTTPSTAASTTTASKVNNEDYYDDEYDEDEDAFSMMTGQPSTLLSLDPNDQERNAVMRIVNEETVNSAVIKNLQSMVQPNNAKQQLNMSDSAAATALNESSRAATKITTTTSSFASSTTLPSSKSFQTKTSLKTPTTPSTASTKDISSPATTFESIDRSALNISSRTTVSESLEVSPSDAEYEYYEVAYEYDNENETSMSLMDMTDSSTISILTKTSDLTEAIPASAIETTHSRTSPASLTTNEVTASSNGAVATTLSSLTTTTLAATTPKTTVLSPKETSATTTLVSVTASMASSELSTAKALPLSSTTARTPSVSIAATAAASTPTSSRRTTGTATTLPSLLSTFFQNVPITSTKASLKLLTQTTNVKETSLATTSVPISTRLPQLPVLQSVDEFFAVKAVGPIDLPTPSDVSRIEGGCPVDVLFVIDSSDSVRPYFAAEKSFVKSIVQQLNMEKHVHRVGIMQFAGNVYQKLEYSLDGYQSVNGAMAALEHMRHITGITSVGHALEFAFELLIRRRANAKTVLVLMTDGYSSDDGLVIAKALREQKISVYGIGLAQQNDREYLAMLAGGSQNVFTGQTEAEAFRTLFLSDIAGPKGCK